ncbi:LRR receptor-like serine/threonine-protein kinase FLS2 [Vitis vinifera]|uniref:LRR receptor-like serine/threonine-protein kinase FLS2 n=1 Tax=Vitis vinifera TaxID=29760 RepID=A0A438HLA7_VITVI|nr:LRR receptor-like serine/threonine-protein kinase FLS2 [Vitis vinifera]
MLDSNCLNNSILPYLSTLTSLKNLSLSYNSLSGWFPPDELATLVNLEILDVSGNQFNAAQTVKGSENILKLKRLETLDLSDNSLNRSMLRVLSKLPSLRNLKLSDNGLQGPFPAEGIIRNFNNLEMLDLSANLFDASAPMQDSRRLSKLKKLKTLDLDANHFEVSIFQSLAALPSLRNLMLSSNALEGPFPTKELAIFKDLETLDLSYNSLEGHLNMPDSNQSSDTRTKVIPATFNCPIPRMQVINHRLPVKLDKQLHSPENTTENVIFANSFEDYIERLKACPPKETRSGDPNPEFIQWRCYDQMILSWIFSTLTPE